MKTRTINDRDIELVQRVSHKCYGWIIGREQAIDVWCLAVYRKPVDIVNMNCRNVHPASFRQIVRGCADVLGVSA